MNVCAGFISLKEKPGPFAEKHPLLIAKLTLLKTTKSGDSHIASSGDWPAICQYLFELLGCFFHKRNAAYPRKKAPAARQRP